MVLSWSPFYLLLIELSCSSKVVVSLTCLWVSYLHIDSFLFSVIYASLYKLALS
uniref:Uncharacterized protein n=1 Tax=Arundo donax TaxID=35708 RepID=A0A0A9GG74_ARUDO